MRRPRYRSFTRQIGHQTIHVIFDPWVSLVYHLPIAELIVARFPYEVIWFTRGGFNEMLGKYNHLRDHREALLPILIEHDL